MKISLSENIRNRLIRYNNNNITTYNLDVQLHKSFGHSNSFKFKNKFRSHPKSNIISDTIYIPLFYSLFPHQ